MDNLISYKNTFDNIKESLPGSSIKWVNNLREQAINSFVTNGFPTRKDEDWKYTSTQQIEDCEFDCVLVEAEEESLDNSQAYNIVIKNLNVYGPTQINSSDFEIMSLFDAFDKHPKLLEEYLTKYITTNNTFDNLNTAFMHTGVFIRVKEGCSVDKPIIINYHNSYNHKMVNTRNIIIMEDNSSLDLIEIFTGDNSQKYFNNVITQIIANNHSKINHYKIQNEGLKSFHIGSTYVYQATGSEVDSYSFSFGGKLVRSDTIFQSNQEHTSSVLNGLYLAKGEQHIDHHTNIEHHKSNCKSVESYKGILDGKAKSVFNGRVFVGKDAQKIDSNQQNKNLLLSDYAEVNTKPQLEIYADDVKCAHGATCGQLDSEVLFYLCSRGLSKEEARQMLISSFAQEQIDQIKIPALKTIVCDIFNNYFI